MTESRTLEGVRAAVAEALGMDPGEVPVDATIMVQLGAESIDLLDMLYRIERKLGVKIKASDLSAEFQGDLADGQFDDENEIVTPVALMHLKGIMPQIDTAALSGKLEAKDVIRLFTVRNLADLVDRRLVAVA